MTVNKIFEKILDDFRSANEKQVIAEFIKWDNSIEKKIVKRAWIDDIAFAVRSQMFVQNKITGLTINGALYKHVDIYEQ